MKSRILYEFDMRNPNRGIFTNYLVILIILLVIILPLYVIDIFAPCIDNSDWPSVPCYAPPEPSFNVIKRDWSKYYGYKGQDWMELKKSEMLESYRNGTLDKWLESGPPDQNQNVYYFYYLNDQIPNSEGRYASEEFSNQNSEITLSDVSIETGTILLESDQPTFVDSDQSIFVILIIGIIVISSFFLVWRKRK